ncbi:Ribosomal RNA large subunit methyltransferase M [Candidatus Hartigia pinicola]|nr:Ribosomal RNA large subunit methyltransferase M [Candidatus Hartigia pinicola]
MSNKIALYCRSGFEKECAEEITDKARKKEIFGFAQVKKNSGYVIFECYKMKDVNKLIHQLSFRELIFSRQIIIIGELLKDFSEKDRITPIIDSLSNQIKEAGDLRVEVADTNESKKLLRFCRKLTVPLRHALKEKKILLTKECLQPIVIHVFFITISTCYTGYSYSINNSPFYMGIPRLKFPSDAPSRSTLKLEEAFHIFIPYNEWEQRLQSGMNAVDLGACPGGWTYQLVKRNMIVHAVDNGEIAKSLIDTGQVRHHRIDAFKFQPKFNNITWLMCDVVEKPAKVAALITKWLLNGWCQSAIFNLKLPMKKRYENLSHILYKMQNQLKQKKVNVHMQTKQLYHDREEVTVYVQRIYNRVL